MYTYKILTSSNWKRYAHLMFPSLQKNIEVLWKVGQLFMVGVEASNIPVGLVVLEYDSEKQSADMHSLYVAKEHRRLGLATELLSLIRSFCKERQIRFIRFVYYTEKETTSPIKDWLSYQGCAEPRVEALIFRIDHRIAEAPWIREKAMPNGLQLLPWLEIEEEKRKKLFMDSDAYPSFLSPFKTFAPLEPLNSLGLLSSSGIEGWSISYRLRHDTILYDSLYVAPKYQQSGLSLLMLSKAIRLHLEEVEKIPVGLFAVNVSTEQMFHLAQKWIEPYATKTSEKCSCELHLT